MSGKVVLIGAGPGDPQLLTIRGKSYIEKADCIVYDRLATSELLAYAKKECECIYVGKENHHHTMKQDAINELLAEKASEYPLVVRLKGGDPYVFGRGGEEALFLKEKEISVEVVPGVSSAIAALADAGIPITHRGISKGFQVVTAHSRKDQPAEIDYSRMLDDTITYVFLMGLSHVGEIAERLIAAGKNADTPVAVISNGTTAEQRKAVGTLTDIAQLVKEADLPSPAIIVVGNVAALSDRLNFFEERKLFGKRYVVPFIEEFSFTYAQGVEPSKRQAHFDSELERKLREEGAEICSVKVGTIMPVEIPEETFLESLDSDWLLFTSQNGVQAFLWNLKLHGLDLRAVGRSKIAVVGKKTAAALEKTAVRADLIPEKQTGQELGYCLLNTIAKKPDERKKTKITLYGAKESNEELNLLLGSETDFQKLVCYENREAEDDREQYRGIDWKSYDGIFFTSGSSVKRFLRLSNGQFPDKIYSIGPKCTEVIHKETDSICEEARTSSYQGILELILDGR